jgi:hypothetical protein
MGGGSGSSSSTYSPPPEVAAAYKMLLEKASPLVDQQQVRYTPDQAAYYAGLVPATLAPFTPYQVQGMQDVAGLRGFTTPYVQSATDLYTNAANPLNRQQFSGDAVNQYMSPYLQDVLQGAVKNINETNAQQDQQILGNAIAKGAFGGDRAGIVRGQLARQQDLANNATLANLMNQGYTQALGEFNQQQGVDLATQLQNRQLQSAAGTNLLNTANAGQTMALQQALAEMGVGQQQQQQRQQELMTAYQNFLNEQGYPYQQLGWLGNMVSGAATGMGGTTTSNPAQPSGLGQIIGGIGAAGTAASGLAKLLPILGAPFGFNKGGRANYEDGGATPMSKVQPMQFFGGVQIKGANPHMPKAPDPQKQDDLAATIKKATPGLDALNSMFTKSPSKLEGEPAPNAPTPPPRPPEFSDTSTFTESAKGGRIHYASGGDAVPSSLANLSHATSGLPGGSLPSSSNSDSGLGGLGGPPQVDQNAVTTENIYRQLLGRGAEPAAIKARSAELASGASTPQSIIDQTKASPEYASFMKSEAGAKLPPPPAAPAAFQNYQNLVNSGHASLADLQKGYNSYLSSAQTPIMPFQALPTVASAKAASDAAAAANDPTSKLTPEEIASLKQQAAQQAANDARGNKAGGRIHYGSGGGTTINMQYGAPSLADLQNMAELQAGSGAGDTSPNAEALALKDMGLAFGGRARFGKGGPPSSADASDGGGSNDGASDDIFAGLNPQSRAVRNNNPGNIVDSPFARSQLGYTGSDGRFASFETPQHGESAMHNLLQNYQTKGLNTPSSIISRWAPPSDNNNTASYIAQVSQKLGVGPNDTIDVTDPNTKKVLGRAIATVEAGMAPTARGQDLLKQINNTAQGRVTGDADQKTTPLDPMTRLPIKEASTKEGMWGALGMSTTPSERIALFNAFATLAGTPGKFGVGLAAAGKAYSDTLAKHQELYQKGVGTQSEAEQRYALAEKERKEANIVQGRTGYGKIQKNDKGEPIGIQTLPEMKQNAPAQTAQQPSQQAQQSPFQQQAQAPSTGAPNAPIAPVGPGEAKTAPKIDMSSYNYGPVDTRNDANPNSPVNNKEAYMREQAGNFGSEYGSGAADNYKVYQDAIKEYSEDNRAASRNSQTLAEATRALSELPETGVTSAGAFSKLRFAAVDTLNMGARVFGIKDDSGNIMQVDPKAIESGQQLEKLAAITTQLQKHGNEAMGWSNIQRLANPNVDLNKNTSADILANMWTTNAMLRDNFITASKYGEMTSYQGANVKSVVSAVNDPTLYQREQKIISDLLKMKNPNDPNDKLNPIVRLLDGADKTKFNKWLSESEYGVPNLSRVFVPR